MLFISSTRARRGFTLTELAIVLGIIGLILGAIWTAASKVYQNNRITKATNEVLTIAASARAMFSGKGTVPAGENTQFAVNSGFYPPDMPATGVTCVYGTANPCPLGPWNNDVEFTSQLGIGGTPAATNRFEIWFLNMNGAVPAKDCPGFVASVVQQAQNSGLVYVGLDAGSFAVSTTTSVTSVPACSGNVVFSFTL